MLKNELETEVIDSESQKPNITVDTDEYLFHYSKSKFDKSDETNDDEEIELNLAM